MTDLIYDLPAWLVLATIALVTSVVVGGSLLLVYLATRDPFPEVDEFTKRRVMLAPRFDRPKDAA